MKDEERNEWLHGLRGIACVIVVAGHSILAFYPRVFEEITPFRLFFNGELAVYVFFCLSAFVLSHKYFVYRERRIAVSGFLRRYIRLTVPVFGSAALAYLLLYFSMYGNVAAGEMTGSKWLTGFWRFPADFWLMVKFSLYDVYTPHYFASTVYNAVLWTMRIELLGSFLVFTFCFLLGNFRWRWLVYAILLLCTFHTPYFCFAMGLLFSDLRKSSIGFRLLRLSQVRFFIWCIFLISLIAGPYAKSLEAYMLSACGIVLGADALAKPRAFFTRRAFLFLGDLSFSLYLVHLPIIGSLMCWIYLISGSPWLAYAAAVPAFGFAAAVFFRWVDLPSIWLSRRFESGVYFLWKIIDGVVLRKVKADCRRKL